VIIKRTKVFDQCKLVFLAGITAYTNQKNMYFASCTLTS
jgi:hypothetical protein